MKITRIQQTHVVSDESIYTDRYETKIVAETDAEVHHLLAPKGVAFPIEKAIKLGLLDENEPIALEALTKPDEVQTKVVEEPDETKVVEVGSTKHKK